MLFKILLLKQLTHISSLKLYPILILYNFPIRQFLKLNTNINNPIFHKYYNIFLKNFKLLKFLPISFFLNGKYQILLLKVFLVQLTQILHLLHLLKYFFKNTIYFSNNSPITTITNYNFILPTIYHSSLLYTKL
jgi:hypothetical protein